MSTDNIVSFFGIHCLDYARFFSFPRSVDTSSSRVDHRVQKTSSVRCCWLGGDQNHKDAEYLTRDYSICAWALLGGGLLRNDAKRFCCVHTRPSHSKTPRHDFAVGRGPEMCVPNNCDAAHIIRF